MMAMASMAVGFAHPIPYSLIASSISFPHKQIQTLLFSKTLRHSSQASLLSSSSSSSLSPPFSGKWRPCCTASEPFEPESAVPDPAEPTEVVEPDRVEVSDDESAQLAEVSTEVPKGIDIFAVVMVGSRQYIVIPGRSIYTQRLKGANINDKIVLNKVLLVGTKSEAYIGKPVVTNAAVHAVVEEQGLNKKVVVFKFKRKKNYRRNIGHRQPNTRLRITGITGYEDYPVSTLAAA